MRGGSNGGKKSKPPVKPTTKPSKSLNENKAKPTTNQIETKIEIETKTETKNNIDYYFIDFENGIEITEIARLNNLTVGFIKTKLIDFRNKAELEYPNYGKFVSHFKNWLLKNKSNLDKKKYTLSSPLGNWTGILTEDELTQKIASGYFKLEN